MDAPLDRRRFLVRLAAASAAVAVGPLPPAAPALAAGPPAHFPHQDPELVREVVGASHRDLDRVRALVEARPALARAAWDWGFGDWETALGAASHVGRPDIAELLIRHGARPNLFTLAMLGRLAAVRAVVGAMPGVEAVPGPHGITLLAHARAGGEAAAGVAAYLEALGTADPRPAELPLAPEEREHLVGSYRLPAGLRLEIGERRGLLTLAVADGAERNLFPVAARELHPAGVPAVRIRFRPTAGRATSLTLYDGEVTLRADRVG